jgi:hypothetical protein
MSLNTWKNKLLRGLTRKQARASRLSDDALSKAELETGVAALIRLRDAR